MASEHCSFTDGSHQFWFAGLRPTLQIVRETGDNGRYFARHLVKGYLFGAWDAYPTVEQLDDIMVNGGYSYGTIA